MKNRVLRSALAVILVIAMVLTMAACGDDTTAATTAPVATTTPTEAPVTTTAPTVAPATTAPTVAPTTSVEKDTVADDFGIFLEAYDGTYGTKITNADGDKIYEYINEEQSTITAGTTYGYWKFGYSSSALEDEDYSIVVKAEGKTIFESVTSDGSKDQVNTTAADLTTVTKAIYDGDVSDSNLYSMQVIFVDEDEIYILAQSAGIYELELEITIADKSAQYGAWNVDVEDDYEIELTSILTIAKEEITVSIDPIVVMEDEDYELKFTTTAAADGTVGSYVVTTSTEYSAFSSAYGDVDEITGEKATDEYYLDYELSYVKEAAVGTYAVTVTIKDSKGDEVDLDDINDVLANQTIVAVEDTCIYVVSEYDWNEIRDVLTSIGEITNKVYRNVYTYSTGTLTKSEIAAVQSGFDFIADTYDSYGTGIKYDIDVMFFNTDASVVYAGMTYANTIADFTNANYKTQLPLAAARYAALSAEQQAFFQTGLIADINADDKIETEYVRNWAEATKYDDVNGSTDGDVNVLYALAFYDYMEAAQDAVDDQTIIDAFDDVADDANIADYVSGSTYLTSNSSAITAFNTVDTYFNSLSDDDQEIIEEAGVASEFYSDYETAKNAFDAAEVDSVVELIVGAYSAYTKAISNGATVIYQYGTDWAYINSTEVKTLTAQAQAAFDALTDDQQDLLKVTEKEYDGTSAGLQMLNLVNTTGVFTSVLPTTTLSTYTIVTIYDGDDTYDGDDDLTIKEVLDALTDMNDMIATMIQIVNYVNIEDYSVNDSYYADDAATLLYNRLNALVYGSETYSTELAGLYFNTYSGTANEDDYRFAMKDIILAPERNYDAIIAEYQAWIDLLLDFEDYKIELVEAFADGVAAEVADLYDDDDYSDAALSTAADMDNALATAIIEAIMGEGTSSAIMGSTLSTYFTSTATIMKTTDITPVIKATFLSGTEEIEEIYEMFEDYLDIDDIIDAYISAIA